MVMKLKSLFVALVLGLSLWSSSAAFAQSKSRIGFAVNGGPAMMVGSWVKYEGRELNHSIGWGIRASLLLGNWEFSYGLSMIGNSELVWQGGKCMDGQTCTIGGTTAVANFGSTIFHQVFATYNFYFIKHTARPFISISFGGIFGTLGGVEGDTFYGGAVGAGVGVEVSVAKHFFLKVELRYKFLLTSNPVGSFEEAVGVNINSGGVIPTLTLENAVSMGHLLSVNVGFGAHF